MAIWASLRERAVDRADVLSCSLAVAMRIAEDHACLAYRVSQRAGREADSSDGRWHPQAMGAGAHWRARAVIELPKHPNQQGRVLRLLGEQVAVLGAVLQSSQALGDVDILP